MTIEDQKVKSSGDGLLFEFQVFLNSNNAIVLEYGGKPILEIQKALKEYPYHGNICSAVINHCYALCENKIGQDIKDIINKS